MMENRAFDDEQRRLHQAQMQYHQQANLQQQQQQQQHVYPNQQQLHLQDNSMDFRLLQQSYNGTYHNQQRTPSESHHLYEDIVHPYATSASFQRNLTLPLRNNKSCESLDKLASSVRVTNRERTLIVDRINREDTLDDCRPHSETDSATSDRTQQQRNIRRPKKDCRHCKRRVSPSDNHRHSQMPLQLNMQTPQKLQQQIYGEQPIYGLDPSAYGLPHPDYLGPGVVYAIGCNSNDCGSHLVSCSSSGESAGTLPRFNNHSQESSFDSKALITQPKGNRAGMKINSIYAQDQWHLGKDPGLFIGESKNQSSPFQRVYSSSSSSTTDNRNKQSHDESSSSSRPRLRKLRNGWMLQLGRPFVDGTHCTKSLALLLVLMLALLGIGGIALYIVFEPDKLQVIQQYLRSSGANNSITSSQIKNLTYLDQAIFSSTSQPATSPVILDVIGISASSSSSSYPPAEPPTIFDNNVPGTEIETVFVPTSITRIKPVISTTTQFATTLATTTTTTTSTTTTTTTTTTERPKTTTNITSLKRLTTKQHYRTRKPRRSCADCLDDEVCVAKEPNDQPYCHLKINVNNTADACSGVCNLRTHKCHKLAKDAYRCIDLEHHCLEDEWTCNNSLCIPLVKRCDGQMNCYDHSDEYNCECNLETHFHCGNQTSCLPLKKKCDGQVDCFDASDEMNCTSSHESCPHKDDFQCWNKEKCIRGNRFCDGYVDCRDGSDEPHPCQHRCNKYEFACRNTRCIKKDERCNGIDDCGDGSDEQQCRDHRS